MTILLSMVENVKVVVKMFGKLISIDTTHGSVCFKEFIDTANVLTAIEDVRNSSGVPVVKHR